MLQGPVKKKKNSETHYYRAPCKALRKWIQVTGKLSRLRPREEINTSSHKINYRGCPLIRNSHYLEIPQTDFSSKMNK
jgi:hypothetical protein